MTEYKKIKGKDGKTYAYSRESSNQKWTRTKLSLLPKEASASPAKKNSPSPGFIDSVTNFFSGASAPPATPAPEKKQLTLEDVLKRRITAKPLPKIPEPSKPQLKQVAKNVVSEEGCDNLKLQVEELKKEYDSLESAGKMLGFVLQQTQQEYQSLESAGKLLGLSYRNEVLKNKNLQVQLNKHENARKTYELKYEKLKQLTRKEFVHRNALKKYCEENPRDCNVYLDSDKYVLKEKLADQEKYLEYIKDLILAINLEVGDICKGNESSDVDKECFKVRGYPQKNAWAKDHYQITQRLRERRVIK